MSNLIIFCWLFGLFEALLMGFGLLWNRLTRHNHVDGGATEAIIQITTVGNH